MFFNITTNRKKSQVGSEYFKPSFTYDDHADVQLLNEKPVEKPPVEKPVGCGVNSKVRVCILQNTLFF